MGGGGLVRGRADMSGVSCGVNIVVLKTVEEERCDGVARNDMYF